MRTGAALAAAAGAAESEPSALSDESDSKAGSAMHAPRPRKNRRRLYGLYRNAYTDEAITEGTDRDNTGNTTAWVHHGKLFALREDSIPYELDPITLETIGLAPFGT